MRLNLTWEEVSCPRREVHLKESYLAWLRVPRVRPYRVARTGCFSEDSRKKMSSSLMVFLSGVLVK